MSILDLFEIGDLFLSWRFYVGLAVTGVLCWLAFTYIPSETWAWIVAVPIGLIGIVHADSGN